MKEDGENKGRSREDKINKSRKREDRQNVRAEIKRKNVKRRNIVCAKSDEGNTTTNKFKISDM